MAKKKTTRKIEIGKNIKIGTLSMLRPSTRIEHLNSIEYVLGISTDKRVNEETKSLETDVEIRLTASDIEKFALMFLRLLHRIQREASKESKLVDLTGEKIVFNDDDDDDEEEEISLAPEPPKTNRSKDWKNMYI